MSWLPFLHRPSLTRAAAATAAAVKAASRSVFHPATSEGRKEGRKGCRRRCPSFSLSARSPSVRRWRARWHRAAARPRPPVGVPKSSLAQLLRISGSDFGPPRRCCRGRGRRECREGEREPLCLCPLPPSLLPASYNSISCM